MHITISEYGWLAHVKPRHTRAQLVRNIFSLAAELHHEIRVSGQHWSS